MSTITTQDWDAFDRAYKALKAGDLPKARKGWSEIHNLTQDPKARAIAALFLKQESPVAGYAQPLDRWAGGSIDDPGTGTYKDYPDVFVGVFPHNSPESP